MMHGQEKSDRLTVPENLSNKAERSAAEKAEGRSLRTTPTGCKAGGR